MVQISQRTCATCKEILLCQKFCKQWYLSHLSNLGTQIATQCLESTDTVKGLHKKCLEVTKIATEFVEKTALTAHINLPSTLLLFPSLWAQVSFNQWAGPVWILPCASGKSCPTQTSLYWDGALIFSTNITESDLAAFFSHLGYTDTPGPKCHEGQEEPLS